MATLREMLDASKTAASADVLEHEPVPLSVFMQDRAYLGNPPLSPVQYDAVRHAERVYYQPMYGMLAERASDAESRAYWAEPVRMVNFIDLEWGKGAGKDHTCRVISLRVAYLLLCLRSPLDYYLLPEQDTIHLLNVASSAPQANRAFFAPLRRALSRPGNWFLRNDYADPKMGEVEYAKNIQAISGHSDAETQEGLNVLLGVADEIDAFRSQAELERTLGAQARESTRSAEGVLKMLRSSARTRFPEVFKNVRISWPRYKGSMIQQLVAQGELSLAEQGAKSKHYVSGPLATWDVNPRVPGREAFEDDYRDDPLGSAARYECKPQRASRPYFANQSALEDAQREVPRQPLEVEYIKVGSAWQAEFDIGAELVPVRGAIYAMHADLAKNGDRAGIAMAHVVWSEEVIVPSLTADGLEIPVSEFRPHVKVDFISSFSADLGASPPREIQVRWARLLCFELRRRGFNIRRFTFDQFQSLDSMQILLTHGIESERVSTDLTTEPWRNLRDLTGEGRISWPERPTTLIELLGLSTAPGTGKVDHMAGGSKDEADALACAALGAVLLGGREDPSGAQAFPEIGHGLPPAALDDYLPAGFTDPSMLRPDVLVGDPVLLDGMGYPRLPTVEEEDSLIASMDFPGEAFQS